MIIFEIAWENFRKIAQIDIRQMFHRKLKDRFEVYMPYGNLLLRTTIFLTQNTEEEVENVLNNYLQHSIEIFDVYDHFNYMFSAQPVEQELPQKEEENTEEEISRIVENL